MRILRHAILCVVYSAWLPLAWADDIPWGLNPSLNDPIFIVIGAYFPRTDSQVQLNSTKVGLGTLVDFQSALGLQQEAAAPEAAIRIRLDERWRLEGSFFWAGQTGDKVIDQEIHWGDNVYSVGASVTSKVNFSDTRLSAGYSIYKTSDKELGVGLGLHVLGYQASITGTATASGGTVVAGTDGMHFLAPLPVLSGYGGFALNEQWSVGARVDWFSLTYNQYSGGITVTTANLLYQPFRHLGFGIGWETLFLHFSSSSGSWQGKLNYTLQGPTAFLTASF